ncbi:MAG: hypothetical protein ACLQU5_01865 [Isosphaeraceae bacterium]
MAQSAAQIAEGNAVVALLSEPAGIDPSTVVIEGPSPVTVARIISIILALIAAG